MKRLKPIQKLRLGDELNKRLHDSKQKEYKTCSVLPLLLAVTLIDWQMIAIIAGSAVIILASIIYIYLILRERRTGVQTIVVEKIIRHPEDAKIVPVQEQTYVRPSESYVPLIPAKVEEDTDDDEGIDMDLAVTNQYGEVTEVLHSVDHETGIALVVRYNKSFVAKLSQTTDETKGYYTALKNEILSYKRLRSNVSWKYDNIRAGWEAIAKFVVRGKTLCLYLAIDPDQYIDTKYKVERSNDKLYAFTPCLYRIVNPRRVRYAAELMAVCAEQHGLKKLDIAPTADYYLPYQHTRVLIGKNLIKEYLVQERYDDFLRKKKKGYVAPESDDNNPDEKDDDKLN
jgi:hypothetical protein